GDREQHNGSWDGRRSGYAGVVGDEAPDEAAEGEPDGYSDHQADAGERGGLPRDGGAHLSSVETEGLEHREVTPPATYAGDERVADGDQRESGQERGDGVGEPVDLAQAADFGWNGHGSRAREVGVGGDVVLDPSSVGAGCEADEQVATGGVRVDHLLESGRREDRAVREWLHTSEVGQLDAPDDAVRVGGVWSAGADCVADLLVEGPEGDGSERDLVSAVWCVSFDDLGRDRSPQVHV